MRSCNEEVGQSTMQMGATLDPSGLYRYSLWRMWDSHRPGVCFIMLNPSTADATKNDPTIRRCIGFAQLWGFGRLEVVNLFAYRVSQPQGLRQVSDPIGPENDGYVVRAVQGSEVAIAAWGQWGGWWNRDRGVLQLIAQTPLYCLGETQAGYPRHPLYLKKDVRYMPYLAQGTLERGESLRSPNPRATSKVRVLASESPG